MFTQLVSDPKTFLIALLYTMPGFLVGLVLHEYAHAYVAYKSGDDTAYLMGRLSFNPMHHLSLIGTLSMLFIGVGWAKPVPVNPSLVGRNRNHSRRFWFISISVAGVITNFVIAIIAFFANAIMARFIAGYDTGIWQIIDDMLYYMVRINLILIFFNLLPIPPLDGSRVVSTCLKRIPRWYQFLSQYGLIVVMLLAFSGIFEQYLTFFSNLVYSGFQLIAQLFGL